MSKASTFADRIYEAAVVPDLWPHVLDEFAATAGAKDAVLIVDGGKNKMLVPSTSFNVEVVHRHYMYPGGEERTRRLLASQRAGFVTDQDVFEDAEIQSNPLFTELLIPLGYGRGIATFVQVPSGDSIIFHAERPFAAGPYPASAIQRLDAFRAHFARSALLAARLGAERARAAAAALEPLGLPAAVLDHRGRTLAANKLLAAMIPTVIQDRHARIILASPEADKLLAAAIEALAISADHHAVCSIPIAAGEQHPPIIVHLVPIKGAANDIFARSSIILIATPVVPKEVPGANVLQALFDLTPAEARVAREVGNGGTAAEIAKALGVSVTTIRNQIAAVLAKSGLHRQVDLVGLLRGVGVPQKAG